METITNVSPEAVELFEGEGYENRELSTYELERRLSAHGNLFVLGKTDNVIVQDYDGRFNVDTTGWTLFDLLDYLNY